MFHFRAGHDLDSDRRRDRINQSQKPVVVWLQIDPIEVHHNNNSANNNGNINPTNRYKLRRKSKTWHAIVECEQISSTHSRKRVYPVPIHWFDGPSATMEEGIGSYTQRRNADTLTVPVPGQSAVLEINTALRTLSTGARKHDVFLYLRRKWVIQPA